MTGVTSVQSQSHWAQFDYEKHRQAPERFLRIISRCKFLLNLERHCYLPAKYLLSTETATRKDPLHCPEPVSVSRHARRHGLGELGHVDDDDHDGADGDGREPQHHTAGLEFEKSVRIRRG